MARTLRSESAANESMAALVHIGTQQRQQREDWRRILERRDAKRQAFRNTHPPLRGLRGSASVGMLATLVTMLGAALSYVASL